MKGNRNSNERMCVIAWEWRGGRREFYPKQRGAILGTQKFMRLAHAHILDLGLRVL